MAANGILSPIAKGEHLDVGMVIENLWSAGSMRVM